MLFLILLLLFNCKKNSSGISTQNQIGEWQSLGLEDKLVNDLVLINDYLYACAGKDGLYRLNRHTSNAQWEYLGLADTALERTLESGITDVINIEDNLLVSYVAGYQHNKRGIYRTSNNYTTWLASDSGMSSLPDYPTPSQVLNLDQHPANPSIIFAGTSVNLIYKSQDGGHSWRSVYGSLASSINLAMRINDKNFHQIWVGGETGRFAPYLLHSNDIGESWSRISFPPNIGPYTYDNAVYDIAINPNNDNILYFGMLGVIVKTTDKARTFQRILGWDDGIYRHWRLALNPENPEELLSTGSHLYRTTDGGYSWQKISPSDDRSELYALAVDWQQRVLYVSASSPGNGIYKLTF
jgi:hypothetical protein